MYVLCVQYLSLYIYNAQCTYVRTNANFLLQHCTTYVCLVLWLHVNILYVRRI